ncbi:hypothetical protein BGX29_001874, partial [Mortierella sp. GBA35]
MNAVQESNLEIIRLNEFRYNKDNKAAEEALLRHSSTLRDVHFTCRALAGSTVRALLGTCANLERLEVEQKRHSLLDMDLRHFVRSDWVYLRLTCLKLVVEYSRFQNESYFQGNCK